MAIKGEKDSRFSPPWNKKSMKGKPLICIMADYPAWLLPEMDYLPSRTGHATWLHMLRPYFASITHEFEIHWVVMTTGITKPMNLEVDRQFFHLLPRNKKITAMLTAYYFESRQMLKLIKQIKPTVVHAWGTEDAYAMTATRISMLPVLFSLQGCITECLRVTRCGFLMRLLGFYEKYALCHLKRVTGESERACKNMLSINPRLQTSVVEYGVNEAFHKITRSLSYEPSIVFIGGLFAAKGIRELVGVMKSPTMSHIRLEIWGSGPEFGALKASATGNVAFYGHATREQVMQALSRAWALVVPTHCDTGPTVVKEALAAGVPVITTTVAGASEQIADKLSGHVIPPYDTTALEQAILSICKSRETSINMGMHDLDETRKRLSGKTTVAAFTDIYRDMISL